jgi:hypothetical protein
MVAFAITAHTGRAVYEWQLELELIVNGVEETIVVPDGESFRTTYARSDDVAYTWAWFEQPLQLVPSASLPGYSEAAPASHVSRLLQWLRFGAG